MNDSEKPESADDSVTILLKGVKHSHPDAARGLWDRFFAKVVNLARRRLGGMPRSVISEEDVAISVFKSFCLRASRNEFNKLDDQDDLWRILVTLTRAKAAAAIRWSSRQKRRANGQTTADVDQIPSEEPTAEMLVELGEQRERLLQLLPDQVCRAIAERKLNGETDIEIAEALGIADRTVRRKMQLIRATWELELTQTEHEPSGS